MSDLLPHKILQRLAFKIFVRINNFNNRCREVAEDDVFKIHENLTSKLNKDAPSEAGLSFGDPIQ